MMNVNDIRHKSGRVESYSLETNGGITNINSSHHNTQLTTTGGTDSNELLTNKLDFCKWYLDQLQNCVNNVATDLREDFIPAEHKSFIQNCRADPQILLSPEGFAMFLSILPSGENQLETINLVSTLCDLGEELHESSGQRISGPTDENSDHVDTQIQASSEPNILVPGIPKDKSLCESSIDLSQLLFQQLEILRGEMLFNLKFIHLPKQFWHPRYISCLAGKHCPSIQSTIERQYIVLELSNLHQYDKNILFARVQLLTYDGKTHPSKFIVPPQTIVQDQKNQCLSINNDYGCDINNKTILYPLTKIKCNNCQITLQVIMFNPRKKDEVIPHSNSAQESIDHNDRAANKLHDFIEKELDKICKLRIQICRLTDTKRLEYVSEYIDTNLIKESKGSEEFETINPSKITPQEPCECGNEEISVPLNTNSEKAGFAIKIDEKQLAPHEFVGVIRNTIKIKPPPKTPERQDFHLAIAKRNVLTTVTQGFNPYEVLIEESLLDTRIRYAKHTDVCHHGPPNKKRRKK